MSIKVAEVYIWDELAGAVAWQEDTGLATFEYNPGFKTLGWELSPLKLPVSSPKRIYSFPELRKERNTEYNTFKELPAIVMITPKTSPFC